MVATCSGKKNPKEGESALLRISALINISAWSQKVSISIKLDRSGFIENLMVPKIEQNDKYLERSGGMCVLIIVVFNLMLFSS